MIDASIIYGLVGGIVGGIIVNVVSIRYQRREERIDSEKRQNKDHIEKICALLTQIIERWSNEKRKGRIKFKETQNDFAIFSRQMQSITSYKRSEVPESIYRNLSDLCLLLDELHDFPIFCGSNDKFFEKSDEMCLNAKEILDKLR